MTFTGDVSRGKLDANTRQCIADYLATFEGQRVDVSVRKHKAQRSSAQNRRHFALMRVGARSLWEDPSEHYALHDELAHLYFALPPCPKTGLRRRRRTPGTNTKEFSDFTDWCAMKLTELGADLSRWDEETGRAAA